MESLKEKVEDEVKPEDLTPQSLVVLVGCSDGKLRVVAFEGKMARQVHGFVRHIQGGHLKLSKEPVALLMEDAADELFALKEKVGGTLVSRLVAALRRLPHFGKQPCSK